MTRHPEAAVRAWLAARDPLAVVAVPAEPGGCDPRSGFAEAFWLPILGPSALWAARRLVARLEAAPRGLRLPLGPFAAELGLGAGTGASSAVVRTLARLVRFGVARPQDEALAVALGLPPLGRRVAGLPDHLRARLVPPPPPLAQGVRR